MAYEPTLWTNREVEKPRTYNLINNPDGTVTLQPAEGNVISVGTPLVAENMNKIEEGIANALPKDTGGTVEGPVQIDSLLTLSDPRFPHVMRIGIGTNDVFIENTGGGGFLQFKNNGGLALNDNYALFKDQWAWGGFYHGYGSTTQTTMNHWVGFGKTLPTPVRVIAWVNSNSATTNYYYTDDISQTGFTMKLNKTNQYGMSFSWLAIGGY